MSPRSGSCRWPGRVQGEHAAHPLMCSLNPVPQRREARRQEQANNPFYIKSSPSPQKVRLDSLSWRNGPQGPICSPSLGHVRLSSCPGAGTQGAPSSNKWGASSAWSRSGSFALAGSK